MLHFFKTCSRVKLVPTARVSRLLVREAVSAVSAVPSAGAMFTDVFLAFYIVNVLSFFAASQHRHLFKLLCGWKKVLSHAGAAFAAAVSSAATFAAASKEY